MFGVLVIDNSEDGYSSFKVFDTMDEAREYFDNVSCMGYNPVMFDYDEGDKIFIEFYS